MEKFNIDGVDIYKWKRGASTFTANPENGARLMSWSLNLAGSRPRDVIYWQDGSPLVGEEGGDVRGGNPILFPFASSACADGKIGFWKTPQGNVLPMKKHGYAAGGKFEIVNIGDSGFTSKFLPSDECNQAYPYSYEFLVAYRFDELSMLCQLTLINRDKVRIPWGAGNHFYFKMPWNASHKLENYRLLSDARKVYRIGKIPGTLDILENPPSCFADPEFKTNIHCNLKTGVVKFGTYSGEEDVTIIFNDGGKPAPGFCFVTWSECDGRPFYCVEPWMSPPFSPSNPKHFVDPDSSSTFSVEVRLY